jgi:hypothetical protein
MIRFSRFNPMTGRRLTLGLIVVAIGLALGSTALFIGTGYETARAARYHDAPLCGSEHVTSCRRQEPVTIVSHRLQDCGQGSGSSDCTTTYLAVGHKDGQVENIEMSSGYLPSPEFDDGMPATLESFEGTAVLIIGRAGTRLTTAQNPDTSVAGMYEFAAIGAVLAVILGGVASWRIWRLELW